MSRTWFVWVVLLLAFQPGLVGCSDEDAPPPAQPRPKTAEGPQDKEPAPKVKKKTWREKLKKKLARGAEKADAVARKAEAILGAKAKPYVVARNGGTYPDRELHAFLEKIVVRMAAATGEPEITWDFTILNSDELNAFALPGGKVFITRGLLAALDSEAQFADVMGHEMGHVVHRHAIRTWGLKALRKLLLHVAANVERKILEKKPNDTAFVAEALGIGAKFATLKYSRDQELAADEGGVDYALAAGYDPREGDKTFEMFLRRKETSGESESLLLNLLSTHPLDSKRIEKMDAYIAENHPDVAQQALVTSSAAWRTHLARLHVAQAAYEKQRRAMALVASAVEAGTRDGIPEAIHLLDLAMATLPDHAALHFSRGYAKYVGNQTTAAERDLDRAIELDPAHFQARLLRGVIRKNDGHHAGAEDDLKTATTLVPANPAAHYYLGECYEALGNKDNAEDSYEEALRLAPDGSKLKESAETKLSAMRGGN